jgi:hypothetical protein
MIDESMGKVLGMAMAYGVSSLGLLLAYYNYRKRIVKADKVFTGTAWMIIGTTLAVIVVAVFLVIMIAQQKTPATRDLPAVEAAAAAAAHVAAPQEPPPAISREGRGQVSVIGMFLPGVIFLFSLWVTWALYRHFSKKMTQATDSSP